MKRYTKEMFLKDVAKEARLLKKNATAEELEKLDIIKLDPSSKYECIYGLATSHCRSPRAIELIESCCKRFIFRHHDLKRGMKYVSQNVNGATADLKEGNDFDIHHFSSIETYIMQPFAKNKNLIAYLKGEKKELVL